MASMAIISQSVVSVTVLAVTVLSAIVVVAIAMACANNLTASLGFLNRHIFIDGFCTKHSGIVGKVVSFSSVAVARYQCGQHGRTD